MSLSKPDIPSVPSAPAAAPAFGTETKPGSKPKAKSTNPTFLGTGMQSNPSNTGQKTLLGQ